jgi:hypothetical protein
VLFTYKFDKWLIFLGILINMIVSLLMTIASFMGLFMIHYHNTTVYQPQLLLAAPVTLAPVTLAPVTLAPTAAELAPEPVTLAPAPFVSQPLQEFYLEAFPMEDDVIDLDNSSYDDDAEGLVHVEPNHNNETSTVLAFIPFLCITVYITALLCVQRANLGLRLR